MTAGEPDAAETVLPSEVLAWAKGALGRCRVEESYREHSPRTGVWRLECHEGHVFLKLHKEKRKWHAEAFAYRQWACEHGAQVPRLLAVYEGDGVQGLLVTALDGRPLKETALDRRRTRDVYQAAGRLARRVHDSQTNAWFGLTDCHGEPFQTAHEDAVGYMTADLQHWANPGKLSQLACLSPDEEALLHWAHENLGVYRGEAAVPINNDYSPKNWLVNDRGEFSGVVDLECMQWGLRVDSFAELWLKYFPDELELEDAFFAGYGWDPRREAPLQVRNVKIKMGVANIVWGTESQVPLAVERGRRLLRDVL